MTIETRFLKRGEIPRLREVLTTAFGGGEPEAEYDTTWEKVFEHERLIVTTEADQIVGVGGSFSFILSVPGAEIPAAGLTVVGVLPTHRRKGILSQMMRFQLDDARKHAESVSILWASEEIIYQRFGYGMATSLQRFQVGRGHGIFRNDPGPSGRLRLLDEEEALKIFPEVYERVRRETPGMLVRDPDWWKWHRLFDPKNDRDGGSPYQRVVWESDGPAEGYALYRTKQRWNDMTGLAEAELGVLELISTTPEAHRELWRYLFGMDLVDTVTAYFLAVDDPLPQMVLKPRHLQQRIGDAVWLRVVDVKAALEGRAYTGDGTLAFELTDTFCDWNQGTWTLTVLDGKAGVSRGGRDADLSLDAGDLGAAYLGGTSFNQLERAGRVKELKPGAIAIADALFHSNRAPWNPEIF